MLIKKVVSHQRLGWNNVNTMKHYRLKCNTPIAMDAF